MLKMKHNSKLQVEDILSVHFPNINFREGISNNRPKSYFAKYFKVQKKSARYLDDNAKYFLDDSAKYFCSIISYDFIIIDHNTTLYFNFVLFFLSKVVVQFLGRFFFTLLKSAY